jgi:pyroglutamyl-peptidase
MHALRKRKDLRGGFIHVPFLPEQAQKGQASLPLEDMVYGVALAVETALRRKKDLRLAGGQTQ